MMRLQSIVLGFCLLGITGISEAYIIVSQNLSVSAYSASSSWGNQTPDLAFDGNWINNWNAGVIAYFSPWIEVDLGRPMNITKIVLGVEQAPGEETSTKHCLLTSLEQIHHGYPSDTNAFALIKTAPSDSRFVITSSYDTGLTFTEYDGMTAQNERLYVDFTIPVTAQYIQVRSVNPDFPPTPYSWIAWKEIQVMISEDDQSILPAALPAPEPASMILFSAGMAGLVGYRFRNRQPKNNNQPISPSQR